MLSQVTARTLFTANLPSPSETLTKLRLHVLLARRMQGNASASHMLLAVKTSFSTTYHLTRKGSLSKHLGTPPCPCPCQRKKHHKPEWPGSQVWQPEVSVCAVKQCTQ